MSQEQNNQLLAGLFQRRPFERHAFVVRPVVEDVATLLRRAPDGTRFVFNSNVVTVVALGRAWLDQVRTLAADKEGSGS